DFGLMLAYGVGARNVLNTFDSSYAHDMVVDPPTIIRIVLTPAELDTIYWKVRETRFFDQPSFASYRCRSRRMTFPDSQSVLLIRAGGHVHEVHRSSEMCDPPEPEEMRLSMLESLILRLLERRPEYKVLPRPRSAYI